MQTARWTAMQTAPMKKVERETSGDLWPFRGAFCVPTTSKEGNILDRFTGRMTSYCGTRFVVCNSIVFDDSTKEELQSVSEIAEKVNDAFLERGGVPNYSQQMTVFAQAYGDESFDTIDKITEAATQPAATEGGYTPPEDEIHIQTIEIGTYGEILQTPLKTQENDGKSFVFEKYIFPPYGFHTNQIFTRENISVDTSK